ncbi:MAG: ATP-binding protein, partial [Acidobacteriota bacterium]
MVTLHDLTEVKNLARIKKDFVLNVSHELRTPLTAIRGYAETIEVEADEKTRSYAGAILRHTDRLVKIVDDLLTLAAIEEKGAGPELEEVNLGELAEETVKIFEPRAKEKNLAFSLTSDPDLPRVKGDPFRLEQMLINLIDNAIKYTDKGEVRVSLLKRENGVVIEVADTGIGIPEEEHGRVFERFYVVDKSRSRQLGGTGLGLSIVKHIAQAHGGRVELRSTPG